MKVYKIEINENCKWGFYSNENPAAKADIISLFGKENIAAGKLPSLKFRMNESINEGLEPADFMFTDTGNIWLLSEKAKRLLEQKYPDMLCFSGCELTARADLQYYAVIPKNFIEGLDVLRSISDQSCLSGDTSVGIYDIKKIDRFVFKEFAGSYPVFRLKEYGLNILCGKTMVRRYYRPIFVLDEFVRFVEDNGLTGFNFLEVFDSELYALEDPSYLPAGRSSQTAKKTHYTGNYKIPLRHENGIYKLSCIEVPEGDSFDFELDGDCILIGSNDYTVYGVGKCNVPKCTEITYKDGKLFSVYINTEKGKLPVYMVFDFSWDKKSEVLREAINECVEESCNDLLNALEKAEKPLCPTAFEYYYDGEQMHINLQDKNNMVYTAGTVADHMTRCICICAGEQHPNRYLMNYEAFKKIVNGLYNRLSAEIPARFEVTDDFKLYAPTEYD